MIIRELVVNGSKAQQQTSWVDDIECLVRAAHETAFSEIPFQVLAIYSETHDVFISGYGGDWSTMHEVVANEALKQGYWWGFCFQGITADGLGFDDEDSAGYESPEDAKTAGYEAFAKLKKIEKENKEYWDY